jgi:hypothetical protein
MTRNALYGHYLHLWTKSAFFMENKKYQPMDTAMAALDGCITLFLSNIRSTAFVVPLP